MSLTVYRLTEPHRMGYRTRLYLRPPKGRDLLLAVASVPDAAPSDSTKAACEEALAALDLVAADIRKLLAGVTP